jgi:two-component system, LytTR family, response regulator
MSVPYKTLIIDDEKLAIKRLQRLLGRYPDVFELTGEAGNGQEAYTIIEARRPDLIFLDIEMPVMNGFEMLARLSYAPSVVFCTAFDEYAIRAFEENSVDYLLKPVEEERLRRTVDKLQQLSAPLAGYSRQLSHLIEQFKPRKEITAIPVKTGDRILLMPLADITRFEAEDKYVYLCTADNRKFLIDYTLTTLSEKLPDTFIRISRSVVLNKMYIREIRKYFSGRYVLLLNDQAGTQTVSGLSYAANVRSLLEI